VEDRPSDNHSVRDSWTALGDLTPLGFRPAEAGEWHARPAGPAESPDVAPADLVISQVRSRDELAEFESASLEGFGGPPPRVPFRVHAPGVLDDARMHVFLARLNGEVVSVSMAYVSAGVVGVYGVATLPTYRRRGFGAAVTWRALSCAPQLPAVLQPSKLGAGMYRRLGFRRVGCFTAWRGHPQ
jgi:ribosomal protein S18 acetylase RimI-like enzyme